ncbi:MAG: hypothetical protein JXO22_03115 [Phycisphaerae bacterium]|nr:hypothetical protein [Phycisphaerae bacterium]
MIVEFTPAQRDLVLQLVTAASREIGPEIRHTDSHTYKDELKGQRQMLRDLCHLLADTPQPARTGDSDLVGSP